MSKFCKWGGGGGLLVALCIAVLTTSKYSWALWCD